MVMLEPDMAKTVNGDMFLYNPVYRKNPCGVELRTTKKSPEGEDRSWVWTTIKYTGIILLAVIFLINFVGTTVMYGTSLVEDVIIKDMVILNNTQTYDWWVNPPVKPYMQVRVFNYTNVDRFLEGDDDKLHVEELGPYVYRETLERVNVVFNKNGTVSYQESRSFKYVPTRSNGSLTDLITVPNMAFLGSVAIMKSFNLMTRLSISTMYSTMKVKPFLTLKASDLFWGYEDPVFTLGKSYLAMSGVKNDPQNQKIGLLVARNGTSSTRITIHTGTRDISQLGLFDRYRGKELDTVWGTEECNRVDGTDGSMWPPSQMAEEATLYMYMKDMCRKFPLVFKQYVEVFNMRAMRFHPPRDVFDNAAARPENACFCHPDATCPPSGVFNSSPCAFNAPIMMSFPHFYLGDPVLLDTVDGLSPDPAKHDMFMDIHPVFGFPMAGESRFQVNIMVKKSLGFSQLHRFEDESILPIAWFEVIVDEVPDELLAVMQDLHFATYTVKRALLYAFLASLSVVLVIAAYWGYTRHMNNQRACLNNVKTDQSLT